MASGKACLEAHGCSHLDINIEPNVSFLEKETFPHTYAICNMWLWKQGSAQGLKHSAGFMTQEAPSIANTTATGNAARQSDV